MSEDPLDRLVQQRRVPHALLLVDATQRALTFAQALVQTTQPHHPDIHVFHPEGKTGMHPMEAIRTLIEQVGLYSFQAPYQVFILHQAERMLPTSANALLKVLEEPTPHTVLLLLTSYPERLLPTLVSRCQTFTYHESATVFAGLEPLLACLAGDDPKTLLPFIEENPEQMRLLLDTALCITRDVWILHHKLSPKLLFFGKYQERLTRIPLRSLSSFEERVREARLGFERQVKPLTVLRYLLHAPQTQRPLYAI